jgi:flagellar protein FliO/FliZ
MTGVFLYVLGAAVLAVAVVAGAMLMRAKRPGASLLTTFSGRKPERRLDIVEQANVDGRRRLVLIRRDDVEHLVMIGGPVDVVIETGISARRGDHRREAPTVLPRQTQPLGQLAGDY